MLHDRTARHPHGPLRARLLSTRLEHEERVGTERSAAPCLLAPEDNLSNAIAAAFQKEENRACIRLDKEWSAGAQGARFSCDAESCRFAIDYDSAWLHHVGTLINDITLLYTCTTKIRILLYTTSTHDNSYTPGGSRGRGCRLSGAGASRDLALECSHVIESPTPTACLAAAGTRSWAAASSERSVG
jgi:hypothetical protein